MSQPAGHQLPEDIRTLLDGTRLEAAAGLTVLLLTVDETGWPRVAMLSAGEVLATGPRTLRLALWPASTTAANLARTGRATLALVHGGTGWYLRCEARARPELALAGGTRLAGFQLLVVEVLADTVPYAELTAGITFHLADPHRTLPAWREAVAALRSADWPEP